jgi:proline iminopeptidase
MRGEPRWTRVATRAVLIPAVFLGGLLRTRLRSTMGVPDRRGERNVRRRALVVACAAVLAGCTTQPEADQPGQARDGSIDSRDGIALYFRTLGVAGDTVVVVHGGPFVDHGYLAPDLEPLAETHVLVFYDQRGTGRSTLVTDAASLHIDEHIADLEAVRRHFGLGRMALLGHSWGALLAAAYARAHPHRLSALVAVSPAPLRRDPYWDLVLPRVTAWMDSSTLKELGALDDARRDPANDARATCRSFFELLLRGAFSDPVDVVAHERMRGDFCSAPEVAIRNGPVVDSLTMASLGDYDWREQFADIATPVLVIAGANDVDPVEAYQEWQAAFPVARLVQLANAGHFPYVEQPAQFFETVTEFLQSHASSGDSTGDSG